MELADRRRITLAVVVTSVALPAIWFASRRDPQPAASASARTEVTEAPQPTYVPEPPVFLEGEAPPLPPAVVQPDTPPASDGQGFDGRATYQRLGTAANTSCSTALAPSGATLTVRNIDNGLEIQCYNTGSIVPPEGAQVVVHTDLLAQICDLADAPIPVRVSW
jgi:hypothetical protein